MNDSRASRNGAATAIVEAFLASYTRAVGGLDVPDIAAHWWAPCLMVMSGEPVLWTTEAGLLGAFSGLASQLADGGFTGARPALRCVDQFGPDLVAASVRWQLLGRDDALLLHLENRYVLMRQGDTWRAKVMSEHRLSTKDDAEEPLPAGATAIARRFLDEYRQVFRGLLPEEVARYWCAPTLALGRDGVQLCTSESEVIAAFRVSLAELQQRGMRDIMPELKAVRPLGPGMLELAVDWELIDQTGASFKRLQNVYLLRETLDGWKIATVYLA